MGRCNDYTYKPIIHILPKGTQLIYEIKNQQLQSYIDIRNSIKEINGRILIDLSIAFGGIDTGELWKFLYGKCLHPLY